MLSVSTNLIRTVGNSIRSSKTDTKNLSLSESNIQEWIKCRSNLLYFIKTYIKFETIGNVSSYADGENFHPKLKRFIRSVFKYKKVTLMASRQLGKSTINAALITWTSLFFPRNKAIILNLKKEAALENLNKIKFMIDELPDFLKVNRTSKSDIKTYMDLANGSSIKVFYPSSVHAKSTIARSLTSPILYIDEAAHIPEMADIFGASQQILSKAREQALKSGYPYFISISSTPNGITGDGEWFFERWQGGVDSDLLFEKDCKSGLDVWSKDCNRIANDPSKNSFINIKYHWSEDSTKSQAWFEEQKRELSDQRKVNQELQLVFVGTNNCIFDDDMLSQFKAQKPVEIVSTPHETHMVVYEENFNPNDFYLIGVDTARSLGGAYNSVEIFSFSKFKQVAEFNFRLGSFTKYGEIIDFIFRWLRAKIGNDNIVLCIENNTIGLAPIEHLQNHTGGDINYNTFIYKEPKSKEFGISTTGISKDLMIGCLTEVLKEDPSIIKSQELINQISGIERNRGGSISSETFSDLFMASCFCAYVRKMTAINILPQIVLGTAVVESSRAETFTSFINLNTNLTSPKRDVQNNIYSEIEIDQLMLVELDRKSQKQETTDYFSPFL